jgi:hypothetical protein
VNVHSSTDKSHPGILNLCKTLVRTKKEQMARVRDWVTRFIVQSTSSGFSRSAVTPGGGSIVGCDIDLDRRWRDYSALAGDSMSMAEEVLLGYLINKSQEMARAS